MEQKSHAIINLLSEKKDEILDAWMKEQLESETLREDLISVEDLRKQSEEFLEELIEATRSGNIRDISAPEYKALNEMLIEISDSRAKQGFSPRETVFHIFSLKDTLGRFLREKYGDDAEVLNRETRAVNKLIDSLGLVIFESFVQRREDLIRRQQEELLELSTPVIQIWHGALVVPLIGTLDSARTQVVMKNLLQAIVKITARVVILDISGVPTVDTLTAQHLLKTVAAARLLGSRCIVSGIRPGIAETIVNLGIDLSEVKTSANLSGALKEALDLLDLDVVERRRI